MGYSAKAIANYFLSKYGNEGISPLKIQKLVYLSHGWYMAFFDDALVHDEYAEAWQYGPVFPSLYHEFKHRGRLPIINLATEIGFDDLEETTPEVRPDDKRTRRLLDEAWKVYGWRTGMQLSDICHREGSPWAEIRERQGHKQNADIPDNLIRDYYKRLGEKNRQRQRQEADDE